MKKEITLEQLKAVSELLVAKKDKVGLFQNDGERDAFVSGIMSMQIELRRLLGFV